MAAERLVPGGAYVNEQTTAQRLVPGESYVNETITAATGQPLLLRMSHLPHLGTGVPRWGHGRH